MSGRLFRSRDDRMLAGVAGGLAEMWDADPSLVRLVWALLVIFTGGIALLVYIVMAIVVPEEDDVVPGGMPAAWPTATPSSSATDRTPTDATMTPTGEPTAAPTSAPLTSTGWVVPPATARQARPEAVPRDAPLVPPVARVSGRADPRGPAGAPRDLLPGPPVPPQPRFRVVLAARPGRAGGGAPAVRGRSRAALGGPRMTHARRGSIVGATWLIGLGVVFLAQRGRSTCPGARRGRCS